jgi:hypothetical protein
MGEGGRQRDNGKQTPKKESDMYDRRSLYRKRREENASTSVGKIIFHPKQLTCRLISFSAAYY